MIGVGLDPTTLAADGWYPLRVALEALEGIEARFGDGTYETVRCMLRDETPNFSSIKRLIMRVVPFSIFLELGPNAYSREFNHGRLEVEVQDHRALVKHYDWIQQPPAVRGVAWSLRGLAPDPQEKGDGHEGRMHAPRRRVLRISDRVVRRWASRRPARNGTAAGN